jgi:hypothetical protein
VSVTVLVSSVGNGHRPKGLESSWSRAKRSGGGVEPSDIIVFDSSVVLTDAEVASSIAFSLVRIRIVHWAGIDRRRSASTRRRVSASLVATVQDTQARIVK